MERDQGRLGRLAPITSPQAGGAGGVGEAQVEALPAPVNHAVTFAVLLAALRCTFQYVLLPFVLPWIGVAAAVPPWVTLALGALALLSLARAVRQLWRVRHAQRWNYLLIAVVITAALVLFVAVDLRALRG